MFIQDGDNQSDASKELVYTLTMVEQLLYNSDGSSTDDSAKSEIDELKKIFFEFLMRWQKQNEDAR